MKNKALFGSLLLVLTAMIWGTAFVFQRVGMERIEPITFNAARMALAAVAVGLLALPRVRLLTPETVKNTLIGGLCCGVCLAAASICQQTGLVYTTAGKAGFITGMYMLLVPVIGFLFFRQKNGPLVWLAVLIGVVGMYLLCMTEDFRLTYGDTWELLCALLFALHILCCAKFVQRADPVALSAVQFVAATVISAAAALALEQPSWDKLQSAAVPILYCGLLSGGLGYTLQIIAQRFTDPTVAALLMSLESVFAAIAGALLLQERLSVRETIGCVVMFAAIVLVQLPGGKKVKNER